MANYSVGDSVEWIGTKQIGIIQALSNDGHRAIVRFDDGERITIGTIGLKATHAAD